MKATIFDGHTTRAYTPQDRDVLSPDTPFVWIDVRSDGADDAQVKPFLASVGFSDVLAAYTTQREGSGMFQQFDNNLVGATWAAPDSGDVPVLVHVVWNAGRMVTVRDGADRVMEEVKNEIDARGVHLFGQPTAVPAVVMELILGSIDRRLTQIAEAVDALDVQIITKVAVTQMQQLRVLRQQLAPLITRLPTYLDNVTEALTDPSTLPGVDATGAQYLQAYSARVQSTVSRVSTVSDAIRNAAQDYQTEIGNKQGQRINQLTIVSILFLPVTFLTGYFGMNFQWLVNSTQTFGTWVTLGVLLPVAIVLASAAILARRGFSLARKPASSDDVG